MWELLADILRESWAVLGQMAPYLLFGFLMAGVLSVCIPPEMVGRHLSGRGFAPALKATLLGMPMPLCSCGVLPVSASFRRHGANRAAVTSFLLSTPQTGVDCIAITYGLLGLTFALFAAAAALVMGLLGGLLVMLFGPAERDSAAGNPGATACSESCCAGRQRRNVVRRVLEYGFVVLPRDIALPLLAGAFIAGAIGALVPQNQWQPYLGGGIVAILLLMALSVPIYVCTSASVPIAAGLIHLGASPGAALAFLVAGPATNAATITTVWKLLGGRTAFLYLLTIVLSAVGGGLTLDWLFPSIESVAPHAVGHAHEAMAAGWSPTIWSVLLLLVFAISYLAKPSSAAEYSAASAETNNGPEPRERLELTVEGMTCSHCVAAVTHALSQCRGVTTVQVNLATGLAVVAGERVQRDELVAAVRSAGYRVKTV